MNIRKAIIFVMMVVTLLGGIFLANIKSNIAFATTFSNVSSQLTLVGHNGYSPVSYFDSMGQSSVVASLNYLNNKGEITNQYYMIHTNISHIFGAYSQGNTSFATFSDYIPLANAGVLYAYARVGIVSSSSEDKNKVTITLSQGQSSQSITNSQNGTTLGDGTYSPYYYQTQPIAISTNNNISFAYTNNAKSSIWSKADFRLFEPSIIFKTVANNIVFSNINQTVYHNDVIKLNATNDVLDIVETGSLISYYKNIHKIQYEILEGNSIAKVIGNYLYFSGDISGTVKIRAKTLADSEDNTYLTSQTVIYNYVAQKKNIDVTQNFSDGANIFGTGLYYVGDNVTLVANVKSGYKFYHWTVNEQIYSTTTIYFECQEINQIKLYLIKDISIISVQIKQRDYDGTINAEIESIEDSGILPIHDAQITNLSVAYYSSSAGTKTLQVTNMPILTGTDSIWYNLSSILPVITGTIKPKLVDIIVDNCQKVYGEDDPTFTYSTSGILNGESVEININREEGENVGEYIIDATFNNANYQTQITKGNFTISQKELSFVYADISKVYDKTNQIIFVPVVSGIVFGDNVLVNISANFASVDVGENILLEVVEFEIVGSKKNNYFFKQNTIPALTGAITQKNINVTILANSKVYGNQDPTFSCNIQGIIDGDIINYVITRQSGENVGKYLLEFSQDNQNYNVDLFADYLTITQKNITVNANQQTKIYGNQDPILTYGVDGLVGSDMLLGQLQRTGGEQVGIYTIFIGSLSNSNYSITYTSSTLSITTRALLGEVVFEDKIYDKTNLTNGFSFQFFNLAFEDKVTLEIFAHFGGINIGTHNIIIESYNINNSNYTYSLDLLQSSILPKNIKVIAQNQIKVYGQADIIFLYETEGLIESDILNGNLQRVTGENVGTYSILAGNLTSENNPNYIIEYVSAFLTITKKVLTIQTISLSKFYGESDPEFVYIITNEDTLAYDEKLSDILVGTPSRISGETPGIYVFQEGNIHSGSNNYVLIYQASGSLTIKKIDIKITAQDAVKVYGDPDPTLTFNIEQSVNQFDFALSRQVGENVGLYNIEAVSIYHPYYQIEFVVGVLQIVPRDISIKASDKVKYYGDHDPTFTASIIDGILVGDRLEEVLTGNMQRENGEQIGTYFISQGSLQISGNYNYSFEQGSLTILPKQIRVKANNTSKTYGQADPILVYTITQGSFVNGECLDGVLARQSGEELGEYTINMGSLRANQNYELTFEQGVFTIQKANVLVAIPNIQKTYGEKDPIILFQTFGLPNGINLSGNVSRKAGENIGQYNYYANFYNEYCLVTYEKGYFEIVKRVVEIKSDSHTITYGDVLPNLTYQITNGSILNGDIITGDIYKVPGETAGVYVLNSTLNLGKNYKIEYIKGSVTILPRQITIYSTGASKIYGQADPTMTYEIVAGEILQNDVFSGVINRTQGENVGIYNLIPSFSNKNYNVELLGGTFQILPKQVWLHAQVLDKVYDGTLVAYLFNVAVSGLIDDNISLLYDISNCASYATDNVGENIAVTLHDISLLGVNANNYQILYPTLTGNITYQTLSNNDIYVHAGTNTSLHYGVSLLVEDSQKQIKIQDKNIIKQFDISIMENQQELVLTQNITIEYQMDKNYQNVKVYFISQGEMTLLKSKFVNGTLSFETSLMGNYTIVADNLIWLDILSVVLPLVFATAIGVWFFVKKWHKKRPNLKIF